MNISRFPFSCLSFVVTTHLMYYFFSEHVGSPKEVFFYQLLRKSSI